MAEDRDGLFTILATEVGIVVKAMTDRGAPGVVKKTAEVVVIQLNAAYPGRLAIWHAGDGRANGRGDAARPASRATVHTDFFLCPPVSQTLTQRVTVLPLLSAMAPLSMPSKA